MTYDLLLCYVFFIQKSIQFMFLIFVFGVRVLLIFRIMLFIYFAFHSFMTITYTCKTIHKLHISTWPIKRLKLKINKSNIQNLRKGVKEQLTWNWETDQQGKEAKSRKEEAKKEKKQRKEKWIEWVWENEKHKPLSLMGHCLCHRDSPMTVDDSITNSKMEMAQSLRFLPIFPSLEFDSIRFLFPEWMIF